MSKPDKRVLELRAALKRKLDFVIWARAIDGNTVWVGPDYGSQKRMDALCDELSRQGYSFECNGTPGTSGEYIADVRMPLLD